MIRKFAHAVKMVRRNIRSYRLLSVTIVLSFSLLLGYLACIDSLNYNKYKQVFARDRRLVFSVAETDAYRDRILREKAADIGDTQSLLYYTITGFRLDIPNVIMETGEKPDSFGWPEIVSLPAHVPKLYDAASDTMFSFDPIPITWLDGKPHEDIFLKPDEIIVDEPLYEAVGKACGGVLRCTLSSDWSPDVHFEGAFRIVGTIPGENAIGITHGEGAQEGKAFLNITQYHPKLVLSSAAVNPKDYPDLVSRTFIIFVSDRPESIAKLADSMIPNHKAGAVYEAQDRANEALKADTRTKAIICTALLVILGINLYACFENALHARRFEIGVKRALGASAGHIVMQFLYEGLCVMLMNILISVALVFDLLIVYKCIYDRTPNEYGQYFQWTVYVSPQSFIMFGVCAAALTVVFSLIFAYRSTQVRIADQLKSE